jgi:FtsZ-binding cell division protein ZapB
MDNERERLNNELESLKLENTQLRDFLYSLVSRIEDVNDRVDYCVKDYSYND